MNTDFARQQMIKQQVRAWDVFDEHVLDVFRKVPREQFVPAGFEGLAFADAEIPLGHSQTMLTPTVAGRLLQSLNLNGDEHVLEVGTGSGFLTACLHTLAAHVTSIDLFDDFLQTAEQNLEDSGIYDVELMQMDATKALPQGDFDAIAVTGSVQSFDPRFVAALRPGGRLFVVVGDAPAMAAKQVIRSSEHDWQSETLFETEITPLINGALPPAFQF